MGWGKTNKMNKIFANNGRTVMLAFDHGYFLGPITGMGQPAKVIPPLIPYVDALMLSPGILTTCIEPDVDKAIVLRSSGGSSVLKDDLSNEEMILEVKEAVKLNATAIALSYFVGSPHEKQTLAALAKAINDAAKYEMPVLGVTAVGKELGKRDAKYLSLTCRMGAEFGADIIKTYYCDNFEQVTSTCPVPIVVAGGPKLDTEREVLELVANSMDQGARGVDLGRNVWQNDAPLAMIQAIKAIVHDDLNAVEALELYNDIKNQ
ncbi:MAG TPA: 3-hydroxy-5-phosphonooxypentane-2,4-dione thiolase [Firmicutes bacterium]|nr:3-hydroxy-5-phosphonooxypentane-2,4-dione thiolase [Bacillota bacterium]